MTNTAQDDHPNGSIEATFSGSTWAKLAGLATGGPTLLGGAILWALFTMDGQITSNRRDIDVNAESVRRVVETLDEIRNDLKDVVRQQERLALLERRVTRLEEK